MRTVSPASLLVCLALTSLALAGCAATRPVAAIELRVVHERPTDARSRTRETRALASVSLRNARPGRTPTVAESPAPATFARALPGGGCGVMALCADERRAVDDALLSLDEAGR